ncbi:hypothetical protein V8C40DRAFT_247564 [Trichoderma camerunense]
MEHGSTTAWTKSPAQLQTKHWHSGEDMPRAKHLRSSFSGPALANRAGPTLKTREKVEAERRADSWLLGWSQGSQRANGIRR